MFSQVINKLINHHKIRELLRFHREHKQTHTGTCAGTSVINQQATKTYESCKICSLNAKFCKKKQKNKKNNQPFF